jgi:CDP-diglyceride synthetase
MAQRAGSALVLLGLAAVAVFGGRLALMFVVLLVAAFAAGELYRLMRSTGIVPAVTIGHAAIAALVVIAYARGPRAPALFPFVIAVALSLAFVVMLLRRDRTEVIRAVTLTLLPIIAVGLPAAFVVALRSQRGGYRPAWVFLLMVVVAEAGAATLTWFFRKRAITPRAGRTWEHLAGAVAGALIGGVIGVAAARPPFTWPRALTLALLVGIALTIGDFAWITVEDELARAEAGVKRAPAVVLSRVGGAVLAAPIFFYAFRAFV